MNSKPTYTGVGSRSAPKEILGQIRIIAEFLARKGFVLRSGGADGCDSSFEGGCDMARGEKEIFLPWKGFNKNGSPLFGVSAASETIASGIHPAWSKLTHGGKLLHARNAYQVLGLDLNSPSDFLVCYTLYGALKGGTRTAIVLAEQRGIPVFNLGAAGQLEALSSFVKERLRK